jgi:adenylate cyclase
LIVAITPESDIMSAVYVGNYITLGVTFGVLLISMVVSLAATLLITRPLAKLSKQMHQVSRMSMDEVIENSSSLWEVRNIQNSFFSMVYALKSFKKYVPEAVIRRTMIDNEVAQLDLRTKEATFFFLDIVDFTQISQKLELQQLMEVMGEAMETLSEIITGEYKGFIDKFIGDAIMALWNVPVRCDRHPVHACMAALHCIRTLQYMEEGFLQRGLPSLRCRIGIHHGMALIGNFGSSNRLNYTALGDNVNLAARLEPLCKVYGVSALCSDNTYEEVKDKICCRAVDIVVVKGRDTSTTLY